MKTLLLFLTGLAVAVLATALGSGRIEPGSLLAAAAAAALLAVAAIDRQPRAQRDPGVRPPVPAATGVDCPCPAA